MNRLRDLIVGSLLLLVALPISAQTHDIDRIKSKFQRPSQIIFAQDNPYTDEKYQLGEALFFDPRISKSGITACASCHNPGMHWVDGQEQAVGFGHNPLKRKTPSLYNIGWDELFFWDGRADSLVEQIRIVLLNPDEMGESEQSVLDVMHHIHGYRVLWDKAFGKDSAMTIDTMAMALDIYVRKIISPMSTFDYWVSGDEQAISESAKRGFVLFNEKGNCASCHSSWRFSDGSFHDIGLNDADLGRGSVLPQLEMMQHAFKTVGLRNIAQRPPYMHNGQFKSLSEVIDHYATGIKARSSLSSEIKAFTLTDQEKKDLIAFLRTLDNAPRNIRFPQLPQ